MRRYWIAFWILLTHSIINFTLAAPVAVRDIHGVRVNVDVAEDRITVLQKRMDSDEEWSSDLTSEHGAPGPDPDPEPDSDSDSDSEMESDSESDSDDSDGGEAAQQWEEEFENYESEEEEEGHEEDENEEENHENHEEDGSDSGEEDHEQSPLHSPASQHPAASMYEDLWSKLLKGPLRPRTSTSGAVDATKREFQETDDTRAYVFASISPLLPTPNNPSHKYSDPH
jgi:hypothetical protein